MRTLLMICRIATLLCALICSWAAPISAAEFAMKDSVTVLNDVDLRDGGKVVLKVYAGKTAEVLEVRNDLVRVECAGKTGWLAPADIASRSDAWLIFSERIRKDPKDWQALRARGPIWMDHGKNVMALADLDAALAANPRDAQAWWFRGLTNLVAKEYDKAFGDFSEAIKLDPSIPSGRDLRAMTLIAKAGIMECK